MLGIELDHTIHSGLVSLVVLYPDKNIGGGRGGTTFYKYYPLEYYVSICHTKSME